MSAYTLTGKPIRVVINGQPHHIRTHYQTVEQLIEGMDLTLEPEDIVQPERTAQLSSGDVITIELARPVTITADGQNWQAFTHDYTAKEILAEIGLSLNPRDEITVDGTQQPPDAPLPAARPPRLSNPVRRLFAVTTPSGATLSNRPEVVHLTVHRAVPLTINDEQATSTFYSARDTVGEALLEQGISLFPDDKVTPSLAAPLSYGLRIFIERSTPVTVIVDGRIVETRTHQETVRDVVGQLGISLMGQDFSRPAPDHIVSPNETIEIVRVRETLEIEQEFIPFETKWVPDDKLLLDQQEVRHTGDIGVIKTRSRVRYENGQEVWRETEDRWLDQEPSSRLIAYGTEIIVRTLETKNGPIEYWRRIPMLTTAYSAATSGKSPDHPRYGVTRTGLNAGYGIVAVDPRVIPLKTNIYVPGYGEALAGDTGGRVLGKHIDLGYDEIPPLMYEWRDVYLLTPAPPADTIRYVLPQWPQRP
ncbi:MAG: ubiquitin-like domain-containing protein [Anaerolineae bacterium]|nr:ubiquitin-like domain-containing protein [Anaerolineae bacterium]